MRHLVPIPYFAEGAASVLRPHLDEFAAGSLAQLTSPAQ